MKNLMEFFHSLPYEGKIIAIFVLALVIVLLWPLISRRKKPADKPAVFEPTEEEVCKMNGWPISHGTATYCEAADTPDGEPKVMTIQEAMGAGYIAGIDLANGKDLPPIQSVPLMDVPGRLQQEASSHLGYDAPVMDKPAPSWQKGMAAANVAHVSKAKSRADGAAYDISYYGHSPDHVAIHRGYANVASMNKALRRYGYKSNGQLKEKPVVIEVARPAKVGEYIRLLHSDYEAEGMIAGDVCKVSSLTAHGSACLLKKHNPKITKDPDREGWIFYAHEYVVLEGYEPETSI